MNKRILSYILCMLFVCTLCACGKTPQSATPSTEAAGFVQMGNPWVAYETLVEAEAAVGFDFPLEETVEGSYVAESFRVCNRELLEVVYRDGTFEVTVRMQAGEHPDISGNYTVFDHTVPFEDDSKSGVYKYNDNHPAKLKLLVYNGYSYSFDAPNGYWGDSAIGFAHFCGEV